MSNTITIQPIQLKELPGLLEPVYCSKILCNNTSLIIDAGIFKVLKLDDEMILEFTENNDIYKEINALEMQIIKILYENSVDVLGLQVSKSNLINLFKHVIKLPRSLNDKPYLRIKRAKKEIITINNKEITNKKEMEILDRAKLSDKISISIKFKKLIFHKDSIILDFNCVKLDVTASEECIINDLVTIKSDFNKNLDSDRDSDSEIENEIITSLDQEELLEANSIIA